LLGVKGRVKMKSASRFLRTKKKRPPTHLGWRNQNKGARVREQSLVATRAGLKKRTNRGMWLGRPFYWREGIVGIIKADIEGKTKSKGEAGTSHPREFMNIHRVIPSGKR